MPLTDRSDLYAAVNENGINSVVRHVMRKRPSLFNYGTSAVIADPRLRCVRIVADPEVTRYGNPLMTREDPIPIVGTNGLYGLDFCVQLTDLRIDFHPENAIQLPAELAPLQGQHLSLFARACAGIGCPSDETLKRLPPVEPEGRGGADPFGRGGRDDRQEGRDERPEPKLPPRPIPVDRLECFCLELFVEAHFEATGTAATPMIRAFLDGLEIVDIKPEELENSIECYLRLVLQLVVLPKLPGLVDALLSEIRNFLPTGIGFEIPFGTPQIPHNPAIENDELRLRVNLVTGP